MASQDRTFAYASGPVKMVLLAYPLLVLGDELVAMACIPARLVLAHVVVAAVGVYGFVWLLRLHRSMVARPHVVGAEAVELHRGHLGSASIAREDVVSAVPVDAEALARLEERPRRLDLGGERVLVTVRASRAILVSADEPAALCAALDRRAP